MGVKADMDGEKKSGPNVGKLDLEGPTCQNPGVLQHCSHDGPHTPHGQCQGSFPQLLASASSPSLLTGCADPTTPTGACIERHILAHHVQVADGASLCLQTCETSNQISFPSSPLPAALNNGDPPDSLFLTPSPSRARHSHARPVSAPPHHLERVSGVLLRLVGDHYLCSACGRQLRNIGDELTLETSLRHILSSSDITRLADR